MKQLPAKIVAWIWLLLLCFAQTVAYAGEQQHHVPNKVKPVHGPAIPLSGIIGQTVWSKSPVKPVQCRVDVQTESGVAITGVETGKDGVFRVTLKPGTYVLIPFWIPSGNPRSNLIVVGSAVSVTVVEGEYTALELSFSSD